MPELPEVETMRRGLAPIVGGHIHRIEFPTIPYRPIQISPDRAQWNQLLSGRRVVAVDRIAKRVLVRLDCGSSIVMQPKMAGMAMLSDPPSSEHVRLIVHLQGATVNQFLYWDRRGLGTVHLWDESQCDHWMGPDRLGPDALVISEKEFIHRFQALRRPVKPALLDQKLVAGVGNLYASEILFRARVHPARLCSDVSRIQWKRIYAAMLEILLAAIESEGSTLGDGTYRNAINGEGSYQHQHAVYARDNEPCAACEKGTIVRIVQSQRSTFYCPRCQKGHYTGVK